MHGYCQRQRPCLEVGALLLWREARACYKEERAVCSAEAMRGEGRPVDSAGRPKVWEEWRGRESRGKREHRVVVTRRE